MRNDQQRLNGWQVSQGDIGAQAMCFVGVGDVSTAGKYPNNLVPVWGSPTKHMTTNCIKAVLSRLEKGSCHNNLLVRVEIPMTQHCLTMIRQLLGRYALCLLISRLGPNVPYTYKTHSLGPNAPYANKTHSC